MDRPGALPGGLVSEVCNSLSHRTYLISTALELGQDYWSTTVLPVVTRPKLFGLLRRPVVDVANPVLSIVRNTMANAHEVHVTVKAVVAGEAEDRWETLLPDPEPPDGWSPGALAKLREAEGKPAEPIFSQDPSLEAAYRILLRGSQDPGSYVHDHRYVLWFSCSRVASLLAMDGDIAAVSQVVGEDQHTLTTMLQAAGYDVASLVEGDKYERVMDAMNTTGALFRDVIDKYGASQRGSS